MITQFKFNLKDRKGILADVTKVLGREGINLIGIMAQNIENLADLRLITSDVVKTMRILKENEMAYNTEEIVAVKIPHTPGALSEISKLITESEIHIEYVYPLVLKSDSAILAIKTNDDEKVEELFKENNISILADVNLQV